MSPNYYVYILRCANESYYVGFTTDLEKRIQTHQRGAGSKRMREHALDSFVYHETFSDKGFALKREAQLKKWSRAGDYKSCYFFCKKQASSSS